MGTTERLRSALDSERLPETVRAVVGLAHERRVTTAAASLGYHAFNTLVPLALFLVIGLSLFGEAETLTRLVSTALGVGSASAESAVRSLSENASGRRRAAVLAFLILAWSAVRTFRATNAAFVSIYGERDGLSVVERAVDVGLATVTIPLALALVAGLGVAFTLAVDGVFWRLASPFLLFAALAVAFFPMYYLFPTDRVTVREVVPGTLLAAGAWTLSALLFRVYASVSQTVHFYGVVGGLLLLLTWLYLGGLAILLGAVVNAVLAGRAAPSDEWLPELQ
ncbi:YihY/virulence factor BrkB family protein [Halomarina ordinaria]|uniref:YihY/virulence factor BrkB family protein n=1 Tax=Halomarina ordinaria TaxID=3033939 RepID=A0ABD5UEU0_9EURY|nr:YihY/virulence factor BrkB family protein [Halomarina sp. PSRA2]